MLIGPAGEAKMAMAGIAFNDKEGRPSRYAGRGGLGAVLGSKGLKAIVLDDTGAPGVEPADQDLFKEGRQKLVDAIPVSYTHLDVYKRQAPRCRSC